MFATNTANTKGSFKDRMLVPTGFPIPILHKDDIFSVGISAVGISKPVNKNGTKLGL